MNERGLGFGFTNSVGAWGVLDVCMCFGCGDVGGEGFGPGYGGVVLCLCIWQVQVSVYCYWRIPAHLS